MPDSWMCDGFGTFGNLLGVNRFTQPTPGYFFIYTGTPALLEHGIKTGRTSQIGGVGVEMGWI